MSRSWEELIGLLVVFIKCPFGTVATFWCICWGVIAGAWHFCLWTLRICYITGICRWDRHPLFGDKCQKCHKCWTGIHDNGSRDQEPVLAFWLLFIKFDVRCVSLVLQVLVLKEFISRKYLGSCEEPKWDDDIFWQDFGVLSEWQASLLWPATSPATTLRLRLGSLSPRRVGAAHRMALYMAVQQLLQATCSIIMAGRGQVICVSYYRFTQWRMNAGVSCREVRP